MSSPLDGSCHPVPADVVPCVFLPQVMHPDLLNQNIRNTQYAVRGELYLKVRRDKALAWIIFATNVP